MGKWPFVQPHLYQSAMDCGITKGSWYHLAKVNHGTPCDIPTFLYAPRALGLGAISGLIWKRAAGTTVLTHANADVCEELCCDPENPLSGLQNKHTTHRNGTFGLISASRQLDSTRCGVVLFSLVASNSLTLAQHWTSWTRYFSTIQDMEKVRKIVKWQYSMNQYQLSRHKPRRNETRQ